MSDSDDSDVPAPAPERKDASSSDSDSESDEEIRPSVKENKALNSDESDEGRFFLAVWVCTILMKLLQRTIAQKTLVKRRRQVLKMTRTVQTTQKKKKKGMERERPMPCRHSLTSKFLAILVKSYCLTCWHPNCFNHGYLFLSDSEESEKETGLQGARVLLNKETGRLERGEAVPAPASVFSSMNRSDRDDSSIRVLHGEDLPITMPVLPRPASRAKLCYFKGVKHMHLG